MAKSKRLPNRTDKIEIPSESGIKMQRKSDFPSLANMFHSSMTFTNTDLSKFFDTRPLSYHEEKTTPAHYKPDEAVKLETAIIKQKARDLLYAPFSVSKLYQVFGQQKFPKKAKVGCNKCNPTVEIELIVEFFTHGILDHGDSLQNTEQILERLLDRIDQI